MNVSFPSKTQWWKSLTHKIKLTHTFRPNGIIHTTWDNDWTRDWELDQDQWILRCDAVMFTLLYDSDRKHCASSNPSTIPGPSPVQCEEAIRRENCRKY